MSRRIALEFGLKVVDYMQREAMRLSRELNMKFVLGQSLAETTAYRFARLDLKYFSPAAGRYVKGDIAEGAIYYTNSTHLNVSADVTPLQKVIQEGLFHKYLERRSFYAFAVRGLKSGQRKTQQVYPQGFL